MFTRPWTLSVLLYRHREPNVQLIENYCFTLDYDEFYPVPTTTTPSSARHEPSRYADSCTYAIRA